MFLECAHNIFSPLPLFQRPPFILVVCGDLIGCELECDYGYAVDDDGCETCACAPPCQVRNCDVTTINIAEVTVLYEPCAL